jgi:hypothetical protein
MLHLGSSPDQQIFLNLNRLATAALFPPNIKHPTSQHQTFSTLPNNTHNVFL